MGTQFTPALQGGNVALDSDANTTTGRTVNFALAVGQNLSTIDAGIRQVPGSVGNFVFRDTNVPPDTLRNEKAKPKE